MRKRTKIRLFLAFGMSFLIAGGLKLGMELRWFRAPYPWYGTQLAWLIGSEEAAYNFDVVIPGRVYRSGRPDSRFVKHVRDKYNVQHIVGLTGAEEAHETARNLGMKVTIFEWKVTQLPPREELQTVLEIIDGEGPSLIHCAGGSDRSGYAVAVYRVTRQGWNLDRAVSEMRRYWHEPENQPKLHRELKTLLDSM